VTGAGRPAGLTSRLAAGRRRRRQIFVTPPSGVRFVSVEMVVKIA
jgi:hypothetical protein